MGVDGSEIYAYQDHRGFCVIWHERHVSKVSGLRELSTFLKSLSDRGIKVPSYAFEGIAHDIKSDAQEAGAEAIARAMA